MKHAFIIGHIRVKDTEKWAEYRNRLPATLAPWGAELLFRGELCAVFAGDHGYTDTVVIRFPDLQSAKDWHFSSPYQALVSLRQDAADVVLLAYEEEHAG